MTVHDIHPFNGRPVSRLQRSGYEDVLAAVDHLIVHTAEGFDALMARGLDAATISIVPHGLLREVDKRYRAYRAGKSGRPRRDPVKAA